LIPTLVLFLQHFIIHSTQPSNISWLPTLLLLPAFSFPATFPLLTLGWSLVFELYFYLVLTAFLVLTPRFVIRNTALLIGGLVTLGSIIGFRRPLLVIWMNPMTMEFVFGCLIGLLFAHPRSSKALGRRLALGLATLGTILLAATIFSGYGMASESPSILAGQDCWLRVGLWGLPSALLITGVVFWNPAMSSMPAKLLVFLGDASYSIYLCTIPAQEVTRHAWRFFGSQRPDVGVFEAFLFCVGSGVVCYLLVERPLMRLFHNWSKPIPFREKRL
jgi:peptidoglycan/LPS O-acetylase OafA/YrhL